jgi:hypothetical protein
VRKRTRRPRTGGRDATFAEIQADPGDDFDRAAKAKSHGVIVRAFLVNMRSHRSKPRLWCNSVLRCARSSVPSRSQYLDSRCPRHASQAERGMRTYGGHPKCDQRTIGRNHQGSPSMLSRRLRLSSVVAVVIVAGCVTEFDGQ